MHHQQQYPQASEPTEGAPGHAPPPPAAASAGAVAAGGPMALLSSATEPEPLLKPGSGDPLREEEELDADGLMDLVGQGEEDDPLSAAALQSLIMPSPPTTFFLPASTAAAAASGPSPPIPQHPASAAAAAVLAGSSGGSGTGMPASLLVAAAAAAAVSPSTAGVGGPPIGGAGLEGEPSSFPHAGAAAAMLEPPPVRSNDSVMVAASGGAAGAADFLLMPPPPPRAPVPTTVDASAVAAAEDDSGVGRFQPGRARSSSDSFGRMGGGGNGIGGNGADDRSKRHAPLGQWITPPQPQYESGWGGGLLRKTHSEHDVAGMASAAAGVGGIGIPIGGPHAHGAAHHNPFLAPMPSHAQHQQPPLSSSAPTPAGPSGGRRVGSRLRSLLPASWLPSGGGGISTASTASTASTGNRRKRDDATTATATTASAASTSSSLSSPPSPPSEHQPAMPMAAYALPPPPHVGNIGRSFSFPHSLRSMGSSAGGGNGPQAGSTRPPAFIVSEDALAWAAPGPLAIPGAEPTGNGSSNTNGGSSGSGSGSGRGRGLGGMRRELSYPDIAGMSLSSSPSTNSVLAAAAASSASPSLRPRRVRSGSGSGAAAMLSPQHQHQHQHQHQQILPSPYGASPGGGVGAGALGASPSLPSPLQALAGRAPTTQEERRQLRLAKNRAWGRLRRLRARNLTSLYEAGLREMEEELAALQAHRWGEGHGPAAVGAALGRARCLKGAAGAEEERGEVEAVLGRLRGQLECVGRQAAVLEGLGRALAGEASGFAEPELLAALELSPAQAAQVQAILLDENGADQTGGDASATALVGQAGQRLAALRARLLESGSGRVRPPLLQAIVDAAPAVLEPEQALRALEWLDANREGVAALPCLPTERGEQGLAQPAAAAALFHFSSAEDTPLLHAWGGGGGGGAGSGAL